MGRSMADDCDRADLRIESMIDAGLIEIQRAAAAIPIGEPGECEGCGKEFARLVYGHCGFCRDRLSIR